MIFSFRSSPFPGKFQCPFYGFCPAIREEDLAIARMFHEQLGKPDLRLLKEIIREMNIPGALLLDSQQYLRVGIAKGIDREAAEQVEIPAPIPAIEINTLAPVNLKGNTLVRMKEYPGLALINIHA